MKLLLLFLPVVYGFILPFPKVDYTQRKTILDIDNTFSNVTYFSEYDITISKRESICGEKNESIFVFPGIDMSGFSFFPNSIKTSVYKNTYVVLAGYSKKQTLYDIVNCVNQFIKSKKIKNITIVGESFGGIVAIYMCNSLRYNNVSSLILLNPAIEYENSEICEYINSIEFDKKELTKFILNNGPPFQRVLTSFYEFSYNFPCYIVYYIQSYFMMFSNIVFTSEEQILKRLKTYFSIPKKDIYKACKKIKIPTTIVIGKNDTILPCKGLEISRNIKNSELKELEEVTHMILFSDIDFTSLHI